MEEKHDLSVSGIIRTKYDKKEIKITKNVIEYESTH